MTVTVLGVDQTNAVLEKVTRVPQGIEGTMGHVARYAKSYVQLETPVDTGRLIGNLQSDVESDPDRIYVEVYYDHTYGPYGHRYDQYVKGAGEQAWMHRGRVSTIEDDLQAISGEVERMVEAGVEAYIGGL